MDKSDWLWLTALIVTFFVGWLTNEQKATINKAFLRGTPKIAFFISELIFWVMTFAFIFRFFYLKDEPVNRVEILLLYLSTIALAIELGKRKSRELSKSISQLNIELAAMKQQISVQQQPEEQTQK